MLSKILSASRLSGQLWIKDSIGNADICPRTWSADFVLILLGRLRSQPAQLQPVFLLSSGSRQNLRRFARTFQDYPIFLELSTFFEISFEASIKSRQPFDTGCQQTFVRTAQIFQNTRTTKKAAER
jgi:hypothetical protein